jgi:histidyl-tRNA synthetase
LREFTQWNVDIIGDPSPEADAELIACCVESLREMGLTSDHLKIKVNDRRLASAVLRLQGVRSEDIDACLVLVDSFGKLSSEELAQLAATKGISRESLQGLKQYQSPECRRELGFMTLETERGREIVEFAALDALARLTNELGIRNWIELDGSIVRGLAYYTGTVFEVHETGGKERAIAGGGRYDNLVELFGGPPTPAVGFAMGDVVIALVLQDKGLMPSDDAIARDMGLAPDVFVIASEEAADAHLRPVLAHLRRAGLHARRSYKSTRNVGKLLGEVSKANARYALILKPDLTAELKDMNASNASNETLGPTLNASDLAALAAQRVAPPRL